MSQFRLGSGVGVLALMMACVTVPSGMGQEKKPQPRPLPPRVRALREATPRAALRPTLGTQITLPTQRDLERRIEAVKDYITSARWREVTKALQDILDYPQDAFMPVTRPRADGKTDTVYISVRVEANRLLGGLPDKGREVYEVLSGARAAGLLQEAKRTSDPEKLAEVAQRYFHTRAGAEAADLLGTYHLDRGRYLMASSCLGRLVARKDTPPVTLFKAALAASRAGDQPTLAAAWKRLRTTAPEGLSLGDRQIPLDDLKKMLDSPHRITGHAAAEWPMLGGTPGRNGSANSLEPNLKRKWQRPTVEETASKQAIDRALQNLRARSQPVLPGCFPIAAAGKLVCRTQRGIQAVDPVSGEVLWEASLNGGLDNPLHIDDSLSIKDQLYGWVNMYAQSNPEVLLENTTVGTLATDGKHVFAVEDVCVPPMTYGPYMNGGGFVGMRAAMVVNVNGAVMMQAPGMPGMPPGATGPATPRDVNHNQLVCIDINSGRIQWTVGRSKTALDGAYFLGPPLPLAGKLYAMIEKDQELRLVCLEPRDGKVCWSQPLANLGKSMPQEAGRRTWAAPVAYGEGVLVCPSHAGAVIAVDLLSHSLLWAHSYVPPPAPAAKQPVRMNNKIMFMPVFQPQAPRLAATCKDARPIIAAGKVIITAPDAKVMNCLNLRDGTLVWKADWSSDDCFVAGVFGGKVLVVGKQTSRALSLADGKILWTTAPVGLPLGHGVAAGKLYYLPAREPSTNRFPVLGGLSNGSWLYALDLTTGKLAQRTPLAQGAGNLLLYQGRLVSQSADKITGFAAP